MYAAVFRAKTGHTLFSNYSFRMFSFLTFKTRDLRITLLLYTNMVIIVAV